MVRRRSTVRFRKGARKQKNSKRSTAAFQVREPFWLASGAADGRGPLKAEIRGTGDAPERAQLRGHAGGHVRWEKVSTAVQLECRARHARGDFKRRSPEGRACLRSDGQVCKRIPLAGDGSEPRAVGDDGLADRYGSVGRRSASAVPGKPCTNWMPRAGGCLARRPGLR